MILQNLLLSLHRSGGAEAPNEMTEANQKFNHRFSTNGGVLLNPTDNPSAESCDEMDLLDLSSHIHALVTGSERHELEAYFETTAYENAQKSTLFRNFFTKYSAVKARKKQRVSVREETQFTNALVPSERNLLLLNIRGTTQGLLHRVTHKKLELEESFPKELILRIFAIIVNYFTLIRYETAISYLTQADEKLQQELRALEPRVLDGNKEVEDLYLTQLPLESTMIGPFLIKLGINEANNPVFVEALKAKLDKDWPITRQNARYETDEDKQKVDALLAKLPMPVEKIHSSLIEKGFPPAQNRSLQEGQFVGILTQKILARKLTSQQLDEKAVFNELMIESLKQLKQGSIDGLENSIEFLERYANEGPRLCYPMLQSVINEDEHMLIADQILKNFGYSDLSPAILSVMRENISSAYKEAQQRIPENSPNCEERRKNMIADLVNLDFLNIIAAEKEIDNSFVAEKLAAINGCGKKKGIISRKQFGIFQAEAAKWKPAPQRIARAQ